MSLNPRQIAKLGITSFIALIVSIAIGTAVSFSAVLFAWAILLTILNIKFKFPKYQLKDVTYLAIIFCLLGITQKPSSVVLEITLVVTTIIHIYLISTNKDIKFTVSEFFRMDS